MHEMISKRCFFVKTFIAGLMCLCLVACQDTVKITVPGTAPVLAVDAWITDRPGGDTISLYKTQNYFDNSPNPVVSGAILAISNDSATETLKEVKAGKYLLQSLRAELGKTYTLHIHTGLDSYTASTTIARTSPILDSVRFQYKPKSPLVDSAGYYAFLFGQELPGIGDHVRIRYNVNGVLQNHKENLDIFDDRFTDGNYLSGFRINQRSPFKVGNHITIETWSLSLDAFGFFDDLKTQIENMGLFSKTPVNVRCNVHNLNSAGAAVTGYFGGSLVKRYDAFVF